MDGRYSEALEDQLMWARTLGDMATHIRRNGDAHDDIQPAPLEDMRAMLLEAGTYYWTAPIVQLITAGAATLDDSWTVVDDAILPPTFYGFCRLAEGMQVACVEHAGCMVLERLVWGLYHWPEQREQRPAIEASLIPKPGDLIGLIVGFFRVTATSQFAVGGIPFVVGESIAAALNRPMVQFFGAWSHDADLGPMLVTVFSAGMRFMTEPLVVTAAYRPDRATRRRVERSDYLHEPLVRVVELRRREYERPDTDEHRDVAWSCQWITRGHWHRYHTKDGLQPKWVAPYLKGDPTKPLKRPRAEVFALVR